VGPTRVQRDHERDRQQGRSDESEKGPGQQPAQARRGQTAPSTAFIVVLRLSNSAKVDQATLGEHRNPVHDTAGAALWLLKENPRPISEAPFRRAGPICPGAIAEAMSLNVSCVKHSSQRFRVPGGQTACRRNMAETSAL
jgi:hypothetical protein